LDFIMMRFMDKRTASVLSTILLFAAAGAFICFARRILIVFLLAIFFAFLLEPLVSRLQLLRKVSRGSRTIAILEVYLVLGVIIAAVLLFVGPHIVNQGRKFSSDLPGLIDKVASGKIAWQIGAKRGWSNDTELRIEHLLASHRNEILDWTRSLGSWAATFLANWIWLILIPILAIFFLKDGRSMAQALEEVFKRRRQRQFLTGLVDDLNLMLAHFIRAQLVLAALSLVAYISVLSLLRVPYAVVLGTLGGVLEFIPIIGPLVAATAIVGVEFLANYAHIILLAIFLGAWRLIQDYFNSPRIMGSKLKIHPLATIFAILVGGEIAGVIGVYLSIPIMAALRILWKRWSAYSEAPSASASVIGADDNRSA
jgi:predicted PurR-regulated permease PerM